MLAEPKRKIKWSPNPCGNLWARDTSKFGQKILEKFGWSPGKGLGVNEQGITDPVRLKCNSTQKGLGYDRGNKLECFQHQMEFDSILSELSSSSDKPAAKESCSSLEQASKNCRTRVHYHKFTRGKDLSRYSEKDLSCILGTTATVENRMSSHQENDSHDGNIEIINISEDEYNLVNSPSTNIKTGKLKSNSKSKRKRKHLNDDIPTIILSDDSNFENIEEAESCEILIEQDNNIDFCKNKKKHKKRKNKSIFELNSSYDDEPNRKQKISESCSSFDSSLNSSKKKKKKKKTKNIVIIDD